MSKLTKWNAEEISMDSHTKTKKTLQSFFIMLDNDSDSQIKQVKEYFSQRLSQEGIQRVSFKDWTLYWTTLQDLQSLHVSFQFWMHLL